MGPGGTVRRVRADPVVALGTLLAVALSLVLLAAGPIYSDAIAVGAVRRSLTEAPAASTGVEMTTRASSAEAETVETVGSDVLQAAFGDLDVDVLRSFVSSESFELPEQPDRDRVDLARIAWLSEVDDHVTLTSGEFPTDRGTGVVDVAVHEQAAAALGLEVGRRLVLVPRSGSADVVEARVVAWYEVVDPFSEFWTGRTRLADPLSVSPAFRTVTFLTTRSAMLAGVSHRPEVGLVAHPRFDRIEPDDVEPIRRRLLRLEESAEAALTNDGVESTTTFEVATTAPAVLSGRGRTLSVARSVVTAVVLQLAVLGAFALVLVAGLGVDARQAESAMLRARGASVTHLVAQAAFDAAVIVAPVALAAPFLATGLVAALDDVGPLASGGFRIEPEPVASSWLVVGVASIATVMLLSWPAVGAARAPDAAPRRGRRRRPTGALQRSGIDVAVLVIAVASYWQLRNLGDARATSVRGRFGVDPLLVAAPTFGLVAGAFLALRVVPAAARLAERRIGRTRSATVALTGWQLARRPHRYSRAALLLIMSLAIGTFAVAYESTWSRSQAAQAAHELAADGRLEPNRRTGDSIDPLHLISAIERTPGITAAAAVVREPADLTVSERPGAFVAIDASRVDVLNDETRRELGIIDSLAAVRALRPDLAGFDLPGRPTAVELPVEIIDEPESVAHDDTHGSAPGARPPFAATVTMVLRDGDGMVHRVSAGSLDRPAVRVDLVVDGSDGAPLVPRYPVSVVGIELSSSSLGGVPNRRVAVRLGPIVAFGAEGSRSTVPLVESQLVVQTEVLGFLDEPASVTYAGDAPPEGVSLAIVTGSSFNTVPVIHTIGRRTDRPPDVLPAVGTRRWMSSTGVEIGDIVPVSLGRAESTRVQIVSAVEAIPTVDPTSTDAILVDLPTLLAVEQSTGQPTRVMTEYWFAVDRAVDGDMLTRQPVDAVDVDILRERTRELTTNAAALGAIGALVLGFGAAATFAVAGFLVTVSISARERRAEFALLRALGLATRQHRTWMALEQMVLVVAAAALGTVLGYALSRVILPVVALSQDGSSVYPPVSAVVPWGRVVVLEAVLLGGLLGGVVLTAALRSRGDVGTAVRGGDES